jgi:hypothetical protein
MRNALHVVVAAMLAIAPGSARAQNLRAVLSGQAEIPAIATVAHGTFSATVDERTGTISFELRYAGLEGLAQGAHIHFGQPGVNGGISLVLCSNGPQAPGAQGCPTPGGTISGTLRAGDVIGPENQGIAASELQDVLNALRAGEMYVNVHSTRFPNGEIRGQIHWIEETRGER